MHIPKIVSAEVLEFLAEELYASWHAGEDSHKHKQQYLGGVEVFSIVTGFRLSDIEAKAWALARRYEKERGDRLMSEQWSSGYQEVIYKLACCRFEELNSELVEPRRYKRYADRYGTMLETVKVLTGKSYQEIDRDVIAIYNKLYIQRKEV